jgi:hypothetical protein
MLLVPEKSEEKQGKVETLEFVLVVIVLKGGNKTFE